MWSVVLSYVPDGDLLVMLLVSKKLREECILQLDERKRFLLGKPLDRKEPLKDYLNANGDVIFENIWMYLGFEESLFRASMHANLTLVDTLYTRIELKGFEEPLRKLAPSRVNFRRYSRDLPNERTVPREVLEKEHRILNLEFPPGMRRSMMLILIGLTIGGHEQEVKDIMLMNAFTKIEFMILVRYASMFGRKNILSVLSSESAFIPFYSALIHLQDPYYVLMYLPLLPLVRHVERTFGSLSVKESLLVLNSAIEIGILSTARYIVECDSQRASFALYTSIQWKRKRLMRYLLKKHEKNISVGGRFRAKVFLLLG